MKKLGLLGRWAEFPPTGMVLEGSKPRTIQIEFNTSAKVAVTARELGQGDSPSRIGGSVLVGVVEGLEAFEFRVDGDVQIEIEHLGEPSKVFFFTSEGRNFTIDGEHLRDFAVPMIGRQTRNPELDALRYEMRTQMQQYGELFAQFMATQMRGQNAAPAKASKPTDKKPAKGGASSGGPESGDGGPRAGGDPERSVSEGPEMAGTTDESEAEGGEPSNP